MSADPLQEGRPMTPSVAFLALPFFIVGLAATHLGIRACRLAIRFLDWLDRS